MNDIPQEVLDKLPKEVVEAIAAANSHEVLFLPDTRTCHGGLIEPSARHVIILGVGLRRLPHPYVVGKRITTTEYLSADGIISCFWSRWEQIEED